MIYFWVFCPVLLICISVLCHYHTTSLLAQTVKRLPTMQETQVQSLGQEDLWRRKWQPTSVFLPGKSHGQRKLVGYSPWGRKESDMTERLHFHFHDCQFVVWSELREHDCSSSVLPSQDRFRYQSLLYFGTN